MNIVTEVKHGILFLRFHGIFDYHSFEKFNEEIDYLLYQQGFSYYTFDFSEVLQIEEELVMGLQNKLVEIFLNCGKVVMYGLTKKDQEKIGVGRNQLYYVDNQKEAFNLLYL